MLISNPGIQPMYAGWNVHATDSLISLDYISYHMNQMFHMWADDILLQLLTVRL